MFSRRSGFFTSPRKKESKDSCVSANKFAFSRLLCYYEAMGKFTLSCEDLFRLYWEEKLTSYEIAERIDVTPTQVRYWLRKYGIKIRGTSEANRLAFSKGRRPDSNLKGKESPNWKGGRVKNNCGYILAYAPNHPRATHRYVPEHILVWERVNKRPLPEGYIVHHLNGLRDDNRPENLVALSKKDHNKVDRLKLAEARIRQLEQESVARPEPWERD